MNGFGAFGGPPGMQGYSFLNPQPDPNAGLIPPSYGLREQLQWDAPSAGMQGWLDQTSADIGMGAGGGGFGQGQVQFPTFDRALWDQQQAGQGGLAQEESGGFPAFGGFGEAPMGIPVPPSLMPLPYAPGAGALSWEMFL